MEATNLPGGSLRNFREIFGGLLQSHGRNRSSPRASAEKRRVALPFPTPIHGSPAPVLDNITVRILIYNSREIVLPCT